MPSKMVRSNPAGYGPQTRGPVKHLLIWLDRGDIAFEAVDGDVLRKFLTH